MSRGYTAVLLDLTQQEWEIFGWVTGKPLVGLFENQGIVKKN